MTSLRGLRLGFVTLFALAFYAFVQTAPTEAVTTTASLPKEPVSQIQICTIDGQKFSLNDMRGKVVVLDFFGMRCAHSRDHILETMNRYTQEDFNRGLQLVGMESEDSTVNQVKQFIRDQKMIYPVAQIDEPTFIRFVNSRDLSAPQTLVFGRDGKLLLHTLGHSAKNEAAIISTIQKALDAK